MLMKILRFALLAFLAALCASPLFAQAGPLYQDIFGHALPAQQHVSVFGQTIAYYDMGHGTGADQPVLVMLHGFGSQADVDFGPALPLLARHRRVIALDQIGAGNSSKPFVAYRVQTYVEFLAEFLRTLGVARFDLLGESLGGWTAAIYAEQASGAGMPVPQRLILEDAAGFAPPAAPARAPRMSVSTVGEVVTGLQAVFYDKALVTQEVARRRLISKLAANDGVVTSAFLTNPTVAEEAAGPHAAAIHMPTLVVWGAQDTTVPPAAAHSYADSIAGARLVFIDRCGHVPSLEQPESFTHAVESFLDAPAAPAQ